MADKALLLTGLMRKAGKLSAGEKAVGTVVRAGKSYLIILAADASQNAEKRALDYAFNKPVIVYKVKYTKDELGLAAGTPACSMYAVADSGFAKKFCFESEGSYLNMSAEDAERILYHS